MDLDNPALPSADEQGGAGEAIDPGVGDNWDWGFWGDVFDIGSAASS